jgi:hypothetical protein
MLQANLSQGPAVLDDGSGDLFADVVAVPGTEGGRQIFGIACLAVENLNFADTADADQSGLDLRARPPAFNKNAGGQPAAGPQLIRRALGDDFSSRDHDRAIAGRLHLGQNMRR